MAEDTVTTQFESLAQASRRTGVCIRTLRRRISAGELPAYRMGTRLIRVNPADVDRLMVKVSTRWPGQTLA